MRAQNCSIDSGSSAPPLGELAFILVLSVGLRVNSTGDKP